MKTMRTPFLAAMIVCAAAFLAGYYGFSFAQDRSFADSEKQRAEIKKGLATVEDLSTAFRHVGRVVEPSVVLINVRKKAPVMQQMPFDDDFLRRFFPDRDGDGRPDVPEGFLPRPEDMPVPDQVGTGSGIIVEVRGAKGYIITNNHVAGGAEEMIITLADGRRVSNGKLLGVDPKTDLAVIEIEADRLSAASWGDSDTLQKGDWVLAFGSPFGYVGSMTHGIVSALNRTDVGILGEGGYENFIQVDCPINPGNSGGPLVNLRGEVVGINTAIASRTGGFQGIGFTIPSNLAQFVYRSLRDHGRVVRGWLGVVIQSVSNDPQLARSFGWDKNTGVLVSEVLSDTPATGKLMHGDIITAINGKPANDVQQLREAIAAMPPGTEVELTVFRKRQTEKVTLKLGEQPEDLVAVRQGGPTQRGPRRGPEGLTNIPEVGIQVRTVTPETARRDGLNVSSGVVVMRMEPNSIAARRGLRLGDVITEVDGRPVSSAAEFAEAIKQGDLKKGIQLYVTSAQGTKRFVLLTTEM